MLNGSSPAILFRQINSAMYPNEKPPFGATFFFISSFGTKPHTFYFLCMGPVIGSTKFVEWFTVLCSYPKSSSPL